MWSQQRYRSNKPKRNFNYQGPRNMRLENQNWNNNCMNMIDPENFQNPYHHRNFRHPRIDSQGRHNSSKRQNNWSRGRNIRGRDETYMMLENGTFMNPPGFETRNLASRGRLSRSGSLPPSQDMQRCSLSDYDGYFNKNRLNDSFPISPPHYRRGPLGNQRHSSVHSHSQKNSRLRSSDSVCSDIYDDAQRINDSFSLSSPPYRRGSLESQSLAMKNDYTEFEKSPPLVQRTVCVSNKRDKFLDIDWSDESDNGKKEEPEVNPRTKGTHSMEETVWEGDDESDNESNGDKFKERLQHMVFKYTSDTLPQYDGKSIVGDEGVFQVKVFRCAFCNIICMDKERIKLHLSTKYHHEHYRDYIQNWEIEQTQKKD